MRGCLISARVVRLRPQVWILDNGPSQALKAVHLLPQELPHRYYLRHKCNHLNKCLVMTHRRDLCDSSHLKQLKPRRESGNRAHLLNRASVMSDNILLNTNSSKHASPDSLKCSPIARKTDTRRLRPSPLQHHLQAKTLFQRSNSRREMDICTKTRLNLLLLSLFHPISQLALQAFRKSAPRRRAQLHPLK